MELPHVPNRKFFQLWLGLSRLQVLQPSTGVVLTFSHIVRDSAAANCRTPRTFICDGGYPPRSHAHTFDFAGNLIDPWEVPAIPTALGGAPNISRITLLRDRYISVLLVFRNRGVCSITHPPSERVCTNHVLLSACGRLLFFCQSHSYV